MKKRKATASLQPAPAVRQTRARTRALSAASAMSLVTSAASLRPCAMSLSLVQEHAGAASRQPQGASSHCARAELGSRSTQRIVEH